MLPPFSQSLADEVLLIHMTKFWKHCLPMVGSLCLFTGINTECGLGFQAALLGVESDLGSAA
jgi:hypothetical protein